MTLPLVPREGLEEAKSYFSSPSVRLGLEMVIPLVPKVLGVKISESGGGDPGIMDEQEGPRSLIPSVPCGPRGTVSSQAGPPAAKACRNCSSRGQGAALEKSSSPRSFLTSHSL